MAAMRGGFRSVLSNGSILKNAVLQRVRLGNPALRPLLFSRHESVSSARIEEHGFESTTISDILKNKGKSNDGSWLWCTTDDSVYDAVKSVCIFVLYLSCYCILVLHRLCSQFYTDFITANNLMVIICQWINVICRWLSTMLEPW